MTALPELRRTFANRHCACDYRQRIPGASLTLLASAVLLTASIQAQELPVAAPGDDLIEEVVVYGFRRAFKSSLDIKRDADQVVDAISAEEIGQFPDQNLSEAIQRVSGVQITRANGEGEQVSVRGLSPVFTRVEVDGRTTLVTTDSANPGRASTLSPFSSDLYSKIEVVKSPTAKDAEGGLGGIVRLSTPDPLDIGELSYGLKLAYTDAENRDSGEPALTGFFSNVFADERFGLLLGLTYDEPDRRIDKTLVTDEWRTVNAGLLADDQDPALQQLLGARYMGDYRQEARWGDRSRVNINARMQFMATEHLEFYLNGLYSEDSRDEELTRIQSDWRRGELLSGALSADGSTLARGQFNRQRTDLNNISRDVEVESYGYTAGLNWEEGDWSVNLEAALSRSEEDRTQDRARARINRDSDGLYDISGDAQYPAYSTGALSLAPTDISLRDLDQEFRSIEIEETIARLDVSRQLELGPVSDVAFGLKYRNTEFVRRQTELNADTDFPDGSSISFADGDGNYFVDDFGHGEGGAGFVTAWPSVVPQSLLALSTASDPATDPNTYDVEEETLAAYVMANLESQGSGLYWRGNIGVRAVETEPTGDGLVEIDGSTGGQTLSLDGSYTEFLPSANLLLSANPEFPLQFRFAAGRALSRPTIEEMRPVVEIDTLEATISRGNPDLEPFLAWQYDAGVEYYFMEEGEAVLALTFFYKDIENFITATSFDELVAFPSLGIAEQQYRVRSFTNGGDAEVSGFELNLQMPFDQFLPPALKGLGISANYTFTDSEFVDDNGNDFDFPGASDNAYNLILYFERWGFSGRLAYNYRDEFVSVLSSEDDGSNTIYGEEQGRLDLALRYRFRNGLRLQFDVLNITDEQRMQYFDQSNRLERVEAEGTIFAGAVAYSF